jgi:hypothetical protein
MDAVSPEIEELRVSIERLRTLLETLVVRGLRACGADEVAQLRSYAEHLEQAGAGHVAAILNELREKIEADDRSSARTLLKAQTSVRVLDRLLTLRLVRLQYQAALTAREDTCVDDAGDEDDGGEDDDEE